jgi:tRNA (guanine10-N2)-methyltransferase
VLYLHSQTFKSLIAEEKVGPSCDVQVPYRMVVARELEVSSSTRAGLNVFSLKDRRYLGPTSMDHELSCIMCNHGHVRPGSLVLDPFAGTGSILVAAASYGARVLGCDIDLRVLRCVR